MSKHPFVKVNNNLTYSIKQYKKKIDDKLTYGELFLENELRLNTVRLNNASHMITDIEMRDEYIYVDVDFADNDKGKLLKEIIDFKIPFSVQGRYDFAFGNVCDIVTFDVCVLDFSEYERMKIIEARKTKIDLLLGEDGEVE